MLASQLQLPMPNNTLTKSSLETSDIEPSSPFPQKLPSLYSNCQDLYFLMPQQVFTDSQILPKGDNERSDDMGGGGAE